MARSLRPNTTQVPDIILDRWMAELSGSEFKVLMYIVRRTYGFQKEGDCISLSQIAKGIVRRDGTRLDSGTGLNKDTVCTAINALERKGIIRRESRCDETGTLPTFYSLNLDASTVADNPPVSELPTGGGRETPDGLIGKSDRPLPERSDRDVSEKSDTARSDTPTQQQTAQQETDLQETTTTNRVIEPPSTEPVAAVDLAGVSGGETQVIAMLQAQGFSIDDAQLLASKCSAEVISRQVEWLPLRKATKNKLGLLRRAIEGNWSKPGLPKNEKARPDLAAGTYEAKQQDRRGVRTERLKQLYARLKMEAPETYKEFQAYVEEERERQKLRPLIADSPRLLETVLHAFDTEERRIELMVEFLKKRRADLPAYAAAL